MPRQRPPNLRDALKSMHDLHFLSFLASWTTPMGFVAGAMQKKTSYKEVAPRQTPLHCNYTENHHRMAQHLWQLSSPNQGTCGDCQVRSVIILLAHLSQRLRAASGTNLHAQFGHVRQTKGTNQLVPSSQLKQRRKQYWPLELFWWKSQVIAQGWSWLLFLAKFYSECKIKQLILKAVKWLPLQNTALRGKKVCNFRRAMHEMVC